MDIPNGSVGSNAQLDHFSFGALVDPGIRRSPSTGPPPDRKALQWTRAESLCGFCNCLACEAIEGTFARGRRRRTLGRCLARTTVSTNVVCVYGTAAHVVDQTNRRWDPGRPCDRRVRRLCPPGFPRNGRTASLSTLDRKSTRLNSSHLGI